MTGFDLANPKLYGEREETRQILERQPANRPAPGTAVVTDKDLSGAATEAFFAGPDLGLTLIRPARKDKKESRYFPNWLRQRVEAIIWTLKNQLGLEHHGGRVPGRPLDPRRAAAARTQRLHLAQLGHRRASQTVPDRLRPLSCPDFPVNDLGDQAELACAGDGLGAVGRAELAQDVADVLLDGVEGDHELARDGLV